MPPSAIIRRMSRSLSRTERPIQTAGISPEAIRRRMVRADTLRIAANSSTVTSGSRREARPAATRSLLGDSRPSEREREPAETLAMAHCGILGDRVLKPDFDAAGKDPLLASNASVVEAPTTPDTSVELETSNPRRRKGDEREGPILRAYRIRTASPIPKPDTNQRRFWAGH